MTTPPEWTPADPRLSSPLRDSGVRCELCPHRCRLPRSGNTGRCGVRRNDGGRLVTASYAVAVRHVTPIERKPLYHVRPGLPVLTIAAPGCTFRCLHCTSPELSQYGRVASVPWTGTRADPTELVTWAADHGAAIGLSHTEPALSLELILDLAAAAQKLSARTGAEPVPIVCKTNGWMTPRTIELLAPVLLAVNIGLKTVDRATHQTLTGADTPAPVVEAIAAFRRKGVWVEVSTPLIPDTASHPARWRAIAGEIRDIDPDIPWHLAPFTPGRRLSDDRLSDDPDHADAVEEAARVGRETGLRHVYVEQALGDAGRATTCPTSGCGRVLVDRLIDRDGWRTHLNWSEPKGTCPGCGNKTPGRWE